MEAHWLIYRLVRRANGRLDKLPVHPDTGDSPTSVHVAARLDILEAAKRVAGRSDLGFGYLPRPGSELVGIDLDRAYVGGAVACWVEDWIEDLAPPWVEVSPSGTGLRIIAARCGAPVTMHEAHGVGYYGNASRFFTVTFNLLPGRQVIARPAHALIAEVLAYLRRGRQGGRERQDDPEAPGPPHWFDRLPEQCQLEEVERMLDHLTDPKFGEYETWLRITFAVYRATDGCGYGLWDAWCQKLPGYDAAENLYKWNSIGADPPNPITVGSLIALAKEHGYRLPPDAFHAAFPVLDPEDLARINAIAAAAAARERRR